MADIDGGNGFFSMEMPDIQGLIKQLNLMNEYANQEVRDGLHEAAEIICREQKRLAPYSFLKKAITVGKIKIMKPYSRVTLTTSENSAFSRFNSVSLTRETYYGILYITIGYHADAFNYEQTKNHDYRTYTVSRSGIVHDAEYFKMATKEKPGVIGLTYEFGRPGKSSTHHRNSDTMKQIRMRIPNKDEKRKYWKKAVPTEVDWKKGTIQAQPHIRRGFDNKVNEAVQILVNHINNAIDKAGEN